MDKTIFCDDHQWVGVEGQECPECSYTWEHLMPDRKKHDVQWFEKILKEKSDHYGMSSEQQLNLIHDVEKYFKHK